MTRDEKIKLVEGFSHQLIEHVEAVQVLATWTDQEGTHTIVYGQGNWHARKGMAQDFIDEHNQKCQAYFINAALSNEKEEP